MKYFTINELCRSKTAERLKIDNTPNEEIIENLMILTNHVLDPVREHMGKPIYVNSGYRSKGLNNAVGGVKNSYHVKGCAADIDLGNAKENKPIFDFIKNNLKFTELGWERGGKWIHVAYDKTNLKKKIFYT